MNSSEPEVATLGPRVAADLVLRQLVRRVAWVIAIVSVCIGVAFLSAGDAGGRAVLLGRGRVRHRFAGWQCA